ncbi:hypothetical protein [Nocardia arthritidis]|uniref:Uncharacterized protein n=1 Tax=Nocardia arthritidis TaxID=228602 RepID=A0A6G9YSL3_9NOCA|nr:hypothetical protein [Nocardia arthritidis]QIS16212.1 hypothetical protein F5544_42015 [Nocardia arthritidis]
MRRILVGLVGVLVFGVGVGVARADSFSSSNSGSCSGTLSDWGYYYAYTYQYAYLQSDGTFGNENHNFNFNGFLSGMEDAGLVYGRNYKWAVYRKGNLDLAVPYVSGAGLFVADNTYDNRNWIKLCDY